MNLRQWAALDEQIYVAESDERFKQYAGLPHSEKSIKQLAELKASSARLFLDSFSEPRASYLASVENIADSAAKKLETKMYNLRNQKIVSAKYRLSGKPVNWSNWRQFNSSRQTHLARKTVFDEFILKTKFIAPVVGKRFRLIEDSYEVKSKGKLSPLDGYLEAERVSCSELNDFVKMMGTRAKKPFKELLTYFSKELLGRPAEYYDDFYFFRNIAFKQFGKYFTTISPVRRVKKTLESLGFDLSDIFIDAEDRQGKYPSPICFFIKIPSDIRVLYKNESPYFDLQACYHEMGHAVHASSIDPELEYWDRYCFPMGIAEVFSIFLERLTKDRKYLVHLGIKDHRVLDELCERNRFMELFFVTFYAANSLMKIEFWKKHLGVEEASELYARLMNRYTGIDMPGQYWMLHHILPDAVMYVPSYLLAAVRAAELEKLLKDEYGEEWWLDPKSGDLLKEIMRPGANLDIKRFSKLDVSHYLRQIGA